MSEIINVEFKKVMELVGDDALYEQVIIDFGEGKLFRVNDDTKIIIMRKKS